MTLTANVEKYITRLSSKLLIRIGYMAFNGSWQRDRMQVHREIGVVNSRLIHTHNRRQGTRPRSRQQTHGFSNNYDQLPWKPPSVAHALPGDRKHNDTGENHDFLHFFFGRRANFRNACKIKYIDIGKRLQMHFFNLLSYMQLG